MALLSVRITDFIPMRLIQVRALATFSLLASHFPRTAHSVFI
jgi:hypothetical protein